MACVVAGWSTQGKPDRVLPCPDFGNECFDGSSRSKGCLPRPTRHNGVGVDGTSPAGAELGNHLHMHGIVYCFEQRPVDRRRLDVDDCKAGPLDSAADRLHPERPLWVASPCVVPQMSRVAGGNDFHPRTLSHVVAELDIKGRWPSPVEITRGWARAEARTWNDDFENGFVRLLRGSAGFLRDVSDRIAALSDNEVYSPALLDSTRRVWVRAGYEAEFELQVMERPLGNPVPSPNSRVKRSSDPDLEAIVDVDRAAFEPFWRMSAPGLAQALGSTRTSTTLLIEEGDRLVGYAMVGAQWGTAYLQRLAVDPKAGGNGLGTDLVRASLGWARERAASKVILNVKPGNERAKHLYERLGFTDAQHAAHVYRYAA